MPRHSQAEILAIGMVTPVGLSAPQTAASVRAGIGRLAESYVSDRFGDPLVMGLAGDEQLPPLVEALEDRRLSIRHERLARLGGPALVAVLTALPKQPLPWLLGIAEPRSEARHSVGEELLEILSTQAGRKLDLSHSRTYPGAHPTEKTAPLPSCRVFARSSRGCPSTRAPAAFAGSIIIPQTGSLSAM